MGAFEIVMAGGRLLFIGAGALAALAVVFILKAKD
jgi:hypothetical protein